MLKIELPKKEKWRKSGIVFSRVPEIVEEKMMVVRKFAENGKEKCFFCLTGSRNFSNQRADFLKELMPLAARLERFLLPRCPKY